MTSPSHKVALVTGGGSGIGEASAFAFARRGMAVAILDKSGERGSATARDIREGGGTACFLPADVSKEDEVADAVSEIIKTYGALHAAHNNAGIPGERKPLTDLEEEEWETVLSINLKGVWLCMKHEIRVMLEHEVKGAIVNTASTWSFVGAPSAAAYVASKHGILGLTRTAALEYATKGIRVNAVCPGATRTPLLRLETQTERERELIASHPMGRLAAPSEIAEAVVWLCSEAASFVTGQCLIVDGGFLAR